MTALGIADGICAREGAVVPRYGGTLQSRAG